MPQLDFFLFFGMYSSFFFFFSGMFIFCAYAIPFCIAFSKLSGNRIYYYYAGVLGSQSGLFRVDIAFFTMSMCLCQALLIFYTCLESSRAVSSSLN